MKKINSKTLIAFGKVFLFIFFVGSNFSCSKPAVERKPFIKVTTFAGTAERFGEPFGVAAKAGEIYVSDGEHGKIRRVSSDGSMHILTDKLHTPSHIAFDKNGDLIVADSGSHTIKKIKPNGEIEKVAGIENQSGFADGEAANALFNAPVGIAVSEDKIFVADTYNDKIRVIENGRVSTLAGSETGFGDAENGLTAKFSTPCGIALNDDGNLIVADAGNRRLRVVEPSGKTRTLTGNGESDLVDGKLNEAEFVEPIAVAIGKFGEIYVADGNAIRVLGRRFVPLVETISNTKRGFADGDLKEAKFNRPSGLSIDETGNLFVADAENQALRVFSGEPIGKEISAEDVEKLIIKPEDFRKLGEPRWTFNPPQATREIAGTLGEIRGAVSGDDKPVWFHDGLDVAGAYGETTYFIRTEKVLRPLAAQNFNSLRELVRLPTIGYIHVRLGRDANNQLFNDKRFQFERDENGKLTNVRIPRGSRFEAGERLGTLNAFNHVHLIAGRIGVEMNALDALVLPGATDAIAPVIENLSLFDENWNLLGEKKSENPTKTANETKTADGRIKLNGKTRIVVRAFDRMDGNSDRRKLGVYRLGYQILQNDAPLTSEPKWTISFAKMPDESAARFVYAFGSQSGYTPQTVFNYIVSNEVSGDSFRENFFDAAGLEAGNYTLRVFAADYFGNQSIENVEIAIIK